jgi:hypothetical protein
VFKHLITFTAKLLNSDIALNLNSIGVDFCTAEEEVIFCRFDITFDFTLTSEDIEGVIPWASAFRMQRNSLQSYTQIFFPSYSF